MKLALYGGSIMKSNYLMKMMSSLSVSSFFFVSSSMYRIVRSTLCKLCFTSVECGP